ncbi:MAG: MBL fold metallo-hydrolase [Ilumatobacteraceae bacterium]
MSAIPFVPPIEVEYGRVDQVSPLIRRIVARNPSKYTYLGTGTYVVGRGEVAVIDPGPLLDEHFEAIMTALAGERVVAILVTHCHSDHSPLTARLAAATGAITYGYGPAPVYPPPPDDGLDDWPEDESAKDAADPEAEPAADAEEEPKEGVDHDFRPDVCLNDGAVLSGPGWTFEALHTPGHTSNHLCFALAEEQAIFTGDHVMGWSTSVITPPDGDMAAYLASLRRIQERGAQVLWPTHGGPVTEPETFVAAYLEHRLEREAQVLALLDQGIEEIPSMVAVLYTQVRPELHHAAGRSLLAHLCQLVDDGRATVVSGGAPRLRSRFVRSNGV